MLSFLFRFVFMIIHGMHVHFSSLHMKWLGGLNGKNLDNDVPSASLFKIILPFFLFSKVNL